MKVKFIADFGGRETREVHYKAGEVINLPAEIAERLISDKRAVMVADEQPIATPPQKRKR